MKKEDLEDGEPCMGTKKLAKHITNLILGLPIVKEGKRDERNT